MKSYDNVEKLLKGNLKRKVKLTLATVVAFLITGTLGFAEAVAPVTITIGENETREIINFNDKQGANVINNGSITGGDVDEINYGIYSYSKSSSSSIGAITNSGSIVGGSYGIASYSNSSSSSIGAIENSGSIVGGTSGISSYSNSNSDVSSSTIGDITNNGSIVGGNYGIHSFAYNGNSEIGAIENSGSITGGDYGINSIGHNTSSTIGAIENSGSITGGDSGIKSYSSSSSGTSTIGAITNSGSITGGNSDGISSSGEGNLEIGAITNSGSIVGGNYGICSSSSEGNSEIGAITNSGSIVGKGRGITSSTNGSSSSSSIGAITNSGSIVGGDLGIFTRTIASVNNGGVIVGKKYQAIKGTVTGDYNNYGILAGATASTPKNNYGLNIKLDSSGAVESITRGGSSTDPKTFDGKTIVNATVNGTSTNSIEIAENKNNTIYNGVDQTIEITNTDVTISNSIINGYGSAVSLEGTGKLTLNGTTVNGGGKDVTSSNVSLGVAIIGDEKANNLEINNGIVNGDIDLGDGNDSLTISSDSIINGDINGGAGEEDTLAFVKKLTSARATSTSEENINIFHDILNVENMDIGEDISATLFETVEIKGMKDLAIAEGGELKLKVDSTDKVGDNIKAGALYGEVGENLKVSGEGTLNIVSAGLTGGDKVAFGSTKVETDLEIDSILFEGEVDENGDLTISKANVELSDNVARHGKLKEIYTQIVKDNLEKINTIITTAETDKVKQVEMLSSYLNGVYAENPYSLSSEFSRKSTELMRNSILANREKAIKNEQITYGGLTHQDGSLDGSYYGMDANKVNRYSGDIELESNLFGAYGAIEYGYFDKTSLGFVVGGSRGDSKVGYSKVDGNTIYTGLYSKTDLPYNLRLTVGTGVQHGSYDAERNYLSDNHKGNYSDTAFDIYANIKYTQMLQENLFLDYGFGMSYTYVDQDSISEENKNLAIDVDSKTFDYTDAKLDLGLRKVIGNNYGKHNLKLGASYSYMLDGADEENLRGNFKGTDSFDILVAEKEKDTFGVSLGYELERENGFMLNVNAGYNFSDSDNDEMVVGVQIGKKL